ncbi:MAG: IS200/IS605 family transposase [Polyangiales bacterium]
MSRPYVCVRYHFVWSTWDRAPFLTPAVEAAAYDCIRAKCVELSAVPIALGGMDDHVHLLVGAPATLAPAALIGPVKGAAAHRVNLMPDLPFSFRWQGSYGVFSVSRWDEDRVAAYVCNQRQHHRDRTLDALLEATADEVERG